VRKILHFIQVGLLHEKSTSQAASLVSALTQRWVIAITSSFEGGAKLEEIQQHVGHKDPKNTLRYRRSSPKDAVNAVMRINY
jgi:hypothetical protein